MMSLKTSGALPCGTAWAAFREIRSTCFSYATRRESRFLKLRVCGGKLKEQLKWRLCESGRHWSTVSRVNSRATHEEQAIHGVARTTGTVVGSSRRQAQRRWLAPPVGDSAR